MLDLQSNDLVEKRANILLKEFPNLSSPDDLVFNRNPMGNRCCEALLKSCIEVRKLDVSHCSLSKEIAGFLAEAHARTPRLQYLELAGNIYGEDSLVIFPHGRASGLYY